MNFAVNYLAVIVSAVAGMALNALWYTVIFKRHVDALRAGDPTIAGRAPAPQMYPLALIGQVLMAFVLAVVLKTTGQTGVVAGAGLGALLWLGFTINSMAQIQTFGYRKPGFIAVDGSNWLVAAVLMGAILGAWS